jgi:probable F420-dependent oxidoreductase
MEVSSQMRRVGVTVPLVGLPLGEHRGPVAELVRAGYGVVSTGEVSGHDALTPLILIGGWQPELTLSCAVVSAFTRGPALMAMTAAAMAEAAPGRARFGIGAGSDRIVDGWNGLHFDKPYSRVRDVLRFLRSTLTTGRPDADSSRGLGSSGFRLARVPDTPPKLLVAALGPRMQSLAQAEADGVILNCLSPADIAQVREVHAAVSRQRDAPLEIEVRVFVIPGPRDAAEQEARRQIAAYLTVPVYTNFQRWLGRGEKIVELTDAWHSGDRKRALAVIPDDLVSDLFVTGPPEECAAGVKRYLDAGIDVVTIALLPSTGAPLDGPGQVVFLSRLAAELNRLLTVASAPSTTGVPARG